jgi:hypothetical protein
MTSQNPAAMANWPRLAHESHEELASGKPWVVTFRATVIRLPRALCVTVRHINIDINQSVYNVAWLP